MAAAVGAQTRPGSDDQDFVAGVDQVVGDLLSVVVVPSTAG